MSFIQQFKDRNIPKMLAIYLGSGWLVIESVSFFTEKYDWNSHVFDVTIILAFFGLPASIIHTWYRHKNSSGVKSQLIKEIILQSINILIAGILVGYTFYSENDEYVVEIRNINGNNSSSETKYDSRSVAVMLFKDFSPNKDKPWLSAGISEDILNGLTNITDLYVPSRTESFAFGDTIPMSQIAEELKVEHILEGSVRVIGNSLRVVAQLINGKTGYHVWSNTYDKKWDTDKIIDIQTDIANNIAKSLNILLDEKQKKVIDAIGTKNIDAYEAFLKGRHIYNGNLQYSVSNLSPKSDWDANKWFDKALEIDSTIALAYYFKNEAYTTYINKSGTHSVDDEIYFTNSEIRNIVISNYRNALRYTTNSTAKNILNIKLILYSYNWTGIENLVKNLYVDYIPHSYINITDIVVLLYYLLGQEKTIELLSMEFHKNPNIKSLKTVIDIYTRMGKHDAADSVFNMGKQLKIIAYKHNMLGILLEQYDLGIMEEKILKDISKQYNTDKDKSYEGRILYSALLGKKLQIPIDSILPRYDPITRSWVLWEFDEKRLANNYINDFSSDPINDFHIILSVSRFCYYYFPFEIDSIRNFSRRLRQAGIDPSNIEPMPVFHELANN